MSSNTNPVMTVRQAAELDHAFGRNGLNAEDVKKLSAGDMLTKVMMVLRGYGEIVVPKIEVDCNPWPCRPFDDWKFFTHRRMGKIEYNPNLLKLWRPIQLKVDGTINGSELFAELEKLDDVIGANLLDFFLNNKRLIPESWKGKHVYFAGTIYINSANQQCIRYLYWNDVDWCVHSGSIIDNNCWNLDCWIVRLRKAA